MFIFLSPQLGLAYKIAGALILVTGVIVATNLLENKNKLIPLEAVRLPLMLGFIYALWTFPVTTTVVDTVVINKPANDALDYAGDVSRWPEWHPSSTEVATTKTGTMKAGDWFAEEIKTPIGPNDLKWQITDYQPGQKWSADAENLTNGSVISLNYQVSSNGENQTEFERTLKYTLPNFALVAANAIYFKTKIEENSEQSLERLKASIEAI